MAQPQFDSQQTSTDAASVTSKSHTHTTAGGANLWGLVALGLNGTVGSPACTWGGQSMTLDASLSGAGVVTLYVFRLVGIPSGAQTIAASWTTAREVRLCSVAYSSVDQNNPVGTKVTSTGSGTSISDDVSSAQAELVVDAISVNNGGDDTAGAGQTERYAAAVDGRRSEGSDEDGASTVTMSWTTPSANWCHYAIPIKPTPAAGTQIIWMWAKRWEGFIEDLKRGLLPPDVLQKRYGQLMAAMPA